jgi:Transposase DDE domain
MPQTAASRPVKTRHTIRPIMSPIFAPSAWGRMWQNQAVTKTGKNRNSAIDERTTRHPGYGMSQSRRAMVECIFGWGKQHGTMRKTKHRGIARVAADFLLNLIAYNLIRIPKLLAA